MKLVVHIFLMLAVFQNCSSAPVTGHIIMIPTRYIPPYNPLYSQLRGPFSFLGEWIQNSDWFPIELNIPDMFGAVGNGIQGVGSNIQNFAQTAGNNIGSFAQNVGNGWNNFTQNFGNRFPNLTQILPGFNRPVALQQGSKYIVIVPDNLQGTSNSVDNKNTITDISFDPFEDHMFETFP